MSAAVRSFFADLKRRKVFRVAAVYGATAFVVLQAADLVFPRLALPEWTVTLVVALALLGFPLALVLAWAFETTPEGVRRTVPAAEGELAAIAAQPRSRRWPAGLAALAGVVLLGAGVAWTMSRGGGSAGYDSIAVLPFANLSGDPENEYFGDGLAEELLNALSGIHGLKVAARTSAFAFKGRDVDVRTIADTLGVATVLEGSVRRSADRIRIAAQLIDARTGYHLWSDSYDRPMTELFAVQDAIATEIVDALAIRLAGTARDEGLYRGGTTDVEAYDLYLLGRQKWATRQIPLLHDAVAHFGAAIARDSSFALAWSGLADAIDALAWLSPDWLPRVPDAKYAAQRALLLDPELAEGWASLGVLAADFDRDWRFAELALRRAVALKPSYAPAHGWLSDVLRWSGRLAEALGSGQRVVELDPRRGGLAYGGTLAGLGRWSESREVYLRLRQHGFRNPGPALTLLTSARSFAFTADEAAMLARDWAALAGYSHPEEAAILGGAVLAENLSDEARDLLDRMEAEGLGARQLGQLAVATGDVERAVRLLERGLERREADMVVLSFEPIYDPLRGDPRFQRLLEALRVPNCGPECRMRPAEAAVAGPGR